jgi:hypothetical protein
MNLIVQTPFSWAHRGCEVEHFEKGQTIKTEDADLITVSTAEGWTVEGQETASDDKAAEGEKADKPASNKAKKSAPETK